MKKIAVLAHNRNRSGIYGYARCVYEMLKDSTQFEYEFVECPLGIRDSDQRVHAWFRSLPHDAIIYNWYPGDTNWLNEELIDFVNKPQFVIAGHNHDSPFANSLHNWTCVTVAEPTDRTTPLPRPIMRYDDIAYTPPSGRIKIGSFGFGFDHKNFPGIVKLVNEQFKDVVVELNLHIPFGAGLDRIQETNFEAQKCRLLANPNVELNISHQFIDDQHDLVRWLNQHDLNIFLYDDQPHLMAISSCLDFALSAKKPIALARSSLFRHVDHIPGIWVDQTPLKDIMAMGIEPLQPLYNVWTPGAWKHAIEPILEKHL
jgi:hypothetical protein